MFNLSQQVSLSFNRNYLFIFIQSLFALSLVLLLSSWTFPFSVDSFHFITAADALTNGHGLVFSNFFVEIPSTDFLPVFLQPPGYTLLISSLKYLGMDTQTAAILIPRICYICLPFLFFAIYRRVISQRLAVWISFLCTFFFTMLSTSLMAWSDIPYLCFSLMAIIGVFWIIESKLLCHGGFIFLAGILAGFAFLIRYTGTALILAISFSFLISCILRLIPLNNALRAAAFYAIGISTIILPYLWRNWLVFKNFQPFKLPPNHDSLVVVTHDFLSNLSQVLLSQERGGILVLILIAVCLGLLMRYSRSMMAENQTRFIFVVVLINYFIFNSLFLIFCRAQNLTEAINERYIIAFSWSLIAMIAISMNHYLSNRRISVRKTSSLVIIFTLVAFVLIQALSLTEYYFKENKIKLLFRQIQGHIDLIKHLPSDIVIVSNVADITYYCTKRNVRLLGRYTPQDLVTILGSHRRFVVFLVKEGKYLSPFWSYLPVWDQTSGYRLVSSDNEVDLLSPYYRSSEENK